ncbi:MAG: hypothetical protein Q7T74_00610 [Candidatus Saccharibacteria bacterium]|nr:hypothetical protein [Candidatus Saccharibacteria bacterium]
MTDNNSKDSGAQSQKIWIPSAKERSSWGPDDPKINKPHAFAKEIVKHLELSEDDIDEVDFLADRLMDKLESALMYYQLITAADFDDRNISQTRTIYEGLYANLWSYYKGRVQNYLTRMGWNLSIFFCKESNFEKEVEKFVRNFPEHKDVVELARKQRAAWQTDFANSRNKSEHSGDYRDGTNSYENKDYAKSLFTQVCWTSETLMAYFGSYKMQPDWNIIEINPGNTVFDNEERYIIEHAVNTYRREKAKKS